ncbi:MAG: YdgH/BhsA/McbA-like domain containing protein [Enterobacteriaceae bacterium]
MKKSIIALGFVAGLLSLSSVAAEPVHQAAAGASSLGVITVQGALTVDQVEQQLAEKAQAAGASSYQIISVGGKDKLFAVANIYR